MKIALALIVKGSDKEAEVLSRCLQYATPHVDGVFITITQPNKKVEDVAKHYGAHTSNFEWCNDFAKARNFNFSQVPKEYTHILWLDADDVLRGGEKLRKVLEENVMMDAFSMWYLYDFDQDKQPIVVHQKTRVVKNDGCVEWAGELHEDFRENRSLRVMFIKDIEVLHLTNEERIETAKARNLLVAQKATETTPNDPRSYWNLGNASFSAGEHEEAVKALEKFLDLSESDEEKYLAYLRLSTIVHEIGDKKKSVDYGRYAIGIKPEYPDAYHHMGRLYYKLGMFEKSRDSFLMGLTKKPPIYSIIVYNPRDYDYNPLFALAQVYFELSMPIQALECIRGCLKIYPNNERLHSLKKEMEKEVKRFNRIVAVIPKLQKIKDKEKLKKELDKIPHDIRSHPAICMVKNKMIIKEESSGKDLVIYCGYTREAWNPDTIGKRGVGGSEEAIINLSRELADLGWNVEVYNNCGHKEKRYGKVLWKPFWDWNFRDKQDVVVLWRSPKPVDYAINCDNVCVDVHDVVNEGEFTPERMKKIRKVFFKTKAHRDLYAIPDEKVAIVPNGLDFNLIQDLKKDQYLMVNTSSPDRSLDVLPKLFKRVKEQVPEAKMKWAYGWQIFDIVHGENDKMMKWKQGVIEAMKDAGIENLGRVTQQEAMNMYSEANILAYPTTFFEIDCITVKKAQACGCMPITTDFGALEESVQYGVKIPSRREVKGWAKDRYAFGVEDEQSQNEWVDACVKQLKTPIGDRSDMKNWAHKFEWNKIAELWNKELF